jgi:two-component system OmpR family response regulator
MATILVVDYRDEPRAAALHLLRREGYHAIGANTGQDAMRSLEHDTVDLLLLNVRQPDGLRMLHVLRDTARWRSLPVVMMVDARDDHRTRSQQQLLAQAYLAKTAFSAAQMLSLVKHCIRHPAASRADQHRDQHAH